MDSSTGGGRGRTRDGGRAKARRPRGRAAALAAEVELLRSTLAGQSEAVLRLDGAGNLLLANKAATDLLGLAVPLAAG
ncbi:MAG: hypothetical protein FJX68_10135 [Alphaproteobacteria bacterium]|nr:hypothetical protein [Alphaproteobacteria bacterium]